MMNPCTRAAWRALTAIGIAATAMVPAADARATTCIDGADPVTLTRLFAAGIDQMVGADYQRALELPDHRVLWLFQDAFLRRSDGQLVLVHNVAVIQQGRCFSVLHGGSRSHPSAWIGAELTEPMHRWFWVLGAAIAHDNTIRILVAELHERGNRYLAHSEPVATWMATIDATTLTLISFTPAPDDGPNLYGWSVASNRDHTYLFGHCYRQFGFGFLGHDPCTAEVYVARVPRGHLDDHPQYWNGNSWVTDAASAVNIAPQTGPDGEHRGVNPMQVSFVNGKWIAVTKEGDWWGNTIYLDRAPAPTGPWTTTARLPATPLGSPDTFNTYFASLLPGRPGTVTIGLSNNRWDGQPSDYRPTFQTVPLRMWDDAHDGHRAHAPLCERSRTERALRVRQPRVIMTSHQRQLSGGVRRPERRRTPLGWGCVTARPRGTADLGAILHTSASGRVPSQLLRRIAPRRRVGDDRAPNALIRRGFGRPSSEARQSAAVYCTRRARRRSPESSQRRGTGRAPD
jgi:hypothetical protein